MKESFMKKVLFVYSDSSGESITKRCFYPYSSLFIHKNPNTNLNTNQNTNANSNSNIETNLIHYLLLNEETIKEHGAIIMPGLGANNSKVSKRYEEELFSIIKKYPDKRLIYDIDSLNLHKNNDQPIRFMQNCTDVITTCDTLKEKIEKYNKNTHVIESGVDAALFNACPKAVFDSEKTNISWVSNDFVGFGILKKIVPILEEKYQIAISINTFLPNHFNPHVNNLGSNITKTYQLNDLQTLFSVLKSTDILINPIDKNNIAFSLLKIFKDEDKDDFLNIRTEEMFVNSAIAGVPIISSPSPQTSKAINNGVNGLIASSVDEWVDLLSDLIDNKEKRQAIGDQANKYIRENYTFEALANKYERLVNENIGHKKGSY
jgi:glycosyltransferase involved in cell wall biosynthesis